MGTIFSFSGIGRQTLTFIQTHIPRSDVKENPSHLRRALVSHMVLKKIPPAMQETQDTQVRSLG